MLLACSSRIITVYLCYLVSVRKLISTSFSAVKIEDREFLGKLPLCVFVVKRKNSD